MKKMIFLYMISFLAGCFLTDPEDNPIRQKYLFESEYINYAWGFQHEGFYIDRNGNAYSYKINNTSRTGANNSDLLSEEELNSKFMNNRKFIFSVQQDTLLGKFRLINEASAGNYSDTICQGADMGKLSSICYIYSPPENKYKRIELRVTGDCEYNNLSSEAVELSDWIKSLVLKINKSGVID